jgi:hypothetical protein
MNTQRIALPILLVAFCAIAISLANFSLLGPQSLFAYFGFTIFASLSAALGAFFWAANGKAIGFTPPPPFI